MCVCLCVIKGVKMKEEKEKCVIECLISGVEKKEKRMMCVCVLCQGARVVSE